MTASELLATQSEKAAAFEWLRSIALDTLPDARLADILLVELADIHRERENAEPVSAAAPLEPFAWYAESKEPIFWKGIAPNAKLERDWQWTRNKKSADKLDRSIWDVTVLYAIPPGYVLVPREPTWQPIDTAPKDGRTILLGRYNDFHKWRTLRGQWFSAETIAEEWENDDCEEGWYETSVENDDIPNCWATDPSHWMRLPEPPMLAAAKGETK